MADPSLDQPDNLVLIYLRRIDTKIDRMTDDLSDLKIRMTNVEEGLAGVNRRLDRSEARLDRIERRIDLVEG
jgi:chromosome condensin MukBEF ATPase and DNA-binding subunit MukB